MLQDSRDASDEQACNSSNFDGSNELIELSDDDEFDNAMAEVIKKLLDIFKPYPIHVEFQVILFGKLSLRLYISPYLNVLALIAMTCNSLHSV